MKVSRRVEESLNISLPEKYSRVIDDPNVEKLYDRFTSYIDIDVDSIIESNQGYILDRNNISDLDDGTVLGGLKRLISYGTKKKLLRHREKWFKEWIEPKHFIIGGDGGEGMYFIKLDDPGCHVYRLDMETQKTRRKSYGLSKYIEFLDGLANENT